MPSMKVGKQADHVILNEVIGKDFLLYFIVFCVVSIVADMYAFAAVGLMTWTVVIAALGVKSAGKSFKDSLGCVLIASVLTALTTPPIIRLLLQSSDEQTRIDTMSSLFALASNPGLTNLINFTNPYPEFNTYYQLSWLMIGYLVLATALAIVFIWLRVGIATAMKHKKDAKQAPEAKPARKPKKPQGKRHKPVRETDGTYRIRASDGGNDNLRTPTS